MISCPCACDHLSSVMRMPSCLRWIGNNKHIMFQRLGEATQASQHQTIMILEVRAKSLCVLHGLCQDLQQIHPWKSSGHRRQWLQGRTRRPPADIQGGCGGGGSLPTYIQGSALSVGFVAARRQIHETSKVRCMIPLAPLGDKHGCHFFKAAT